MSSTLSPLLDVGQGLNDLPACVRARFDLRYKRRASWSHEGTGMTPATSPLLTDLYQLNMMQAYLDHGAPKTPAFEVFMRKVPTRRGYLLTPGPAQTPDFASG